MKKLQRSGQAHFLCASSPDSSPPDRLLFESSLFAARGCAPKCEPARRLFMSRTQNLCPQQMLLARANEETFVSKTMCPRFLWPLVV